MVLSDSIGRPPATKADEHRPCAGSWTPIRSRKWGRRNCLWDPGPRRSCISYRLALTGASYAHVSDEEGTTERLLRSEYYRKASKDDAERYFSLKPASV